MALCGHNPYKKELDSLRAEHQKTVERVTELQALYQKALECYDAVKGQLDYLKHN